LTAEKLAKWARTTADALSRLESGVKLQATPEEVGRLADFLGLDDQERAMFFAAAPLPASASAAPASIDQGQPAIQVFLIADVRGYTRFTLERGDEAAARLTTRFANLVREVVMLRRGRLIELRGDEALACFSSVRQALQAAVEMQEHFIQASKADQKMPLPVGIGLDAGEAVPTIDGYRGAALNLAARLCSLAGPGEVLISEVLTHLARRVEGLAYHHRGTAELKGFADPVRIIAVQRDTHDEPQPTAEPSAKGTQPGRAPETQPLRRPAPPAEDEAS
jgi:adenylate cyclase